MSHVGRLKPGQYQGTDMPEGVSPVYLRDMIELMKAPNAIEALELAHRADQFEDGSPVGRHAALEVRRNTVAGRNLAADNLFAEKVAKEKRRLAYGD